MTELLEPLRARRATRAFDPRPVALELQELLWRAVSVAPSHGNSQPTRVLVAESAGVRARLVAALSEGNRQWAPAAPLLFALVANPSHDTTPKNSDGSERELWAFHAGIAAGNVMVEATSLGLIAHPMAAFDEPAARDVFGAPADVRVVAIFAVGYPGTAESLPEDLQPREIMAQERLSLANLVGFDAWHADMGISARELRRRPE
ncbi:MAG: nitroreductase family protein [Tepidiformaceae bacterium]